MAEIMPFFHESFQKSLSDIYIDFYQPAEINYLENELFDLHQQVGSSELKIKTYKPQESDPLLRIELTCITIICKSMPFYAAKIRELFHSHELEINRSLHFHPSDHQEFYYIEIQNLESHAIERLEEHLESAYKRILGFTKDYKFLVIDNEHLWSKSFDKLHTELIEFLLKKGFVLEGGYYQDDTQKHSLGQIKESGEIWDWFQSVPAEEEASTFFARESTLPSFLNDGYLFYIVFAAKKKKLLLEGTFNLRGSNAGTSEIPVLRERLTRFMEKENIQMFSGLGRTVRMVFNYIPTEVLFLLPQESYIHIYSAIVEQSLKTNIRSNGIKLTDDLGLIITTIPERDWSEEIWKEANSIVLEEIFDTRIKNYQVLFKNYIQGFQLIRASNSISRHILFQVSSKIEYIFRPWIEVVESKWYDRYKDEKFPEDLEFREDYKATHEPERAIYDLELVRRLHDSRIKAIITESDSGATVLSAVTRDKEYPLSKWVSCLVHLGLSPISQRVYRFRFNGGLYAKTEFYFEYFTNSNQLYDRLKLAFEFSMMGDLPSDSLSEIIRKTSLNVNSAYFLKSLRDYCLQTNPTFNKSDFNQILLENLYFSESLWKYFESKFSSGKPSDPNEMKELCDKAKTLLEDEILNSLRTALLAIVRTNFFGITSEGENKQIGVSRNAIAYKINSAIPISLPDPRPYREIFVYSANFQGIHLRGGPVARGGLRFSDRPSDYRTEILSLMKTQMVKNSVIVPVGSKGGFVLTKNIYAQKEMSMVEAYKGYIQSLLSLTDNRVRGVETYFASKNGPFAYDDYDPYLVVAADKGTAQLSDTANSISVNWNFWLGDAFASGGSRGYSHKAFGITAKGALVTADRHLRNLGIDFRKESITVVAIGDMGGDVFGNGLLDSPFFRLVAAFNHKHIFLDPNPDPKKSYEERKRLFEDKNSGWDFYNKELISDGGGVFDKNQKSIPISKELKTILGISEDSLSGQALVIALLKAPVDLLYNGGIGTYVKSEAEDNAKVGDPANNEVRINGNDLRARVVSEGGNLGFTQLGRIEYALGGGNIYTDALDNSAGVDLSDHEVNLKIFFSTLLEKKKIKDDDERDKNLFKIADEVCLKVLRDNALQSLCIDVDYLESIHFGYENYSKVAEYLVKKNLLNPITEKIPRSESEWQEIKDSNGGIVKPVLCVLLGYVKMDLYNEILKENILNLKDLEDIYLDYFPMDLVVRYRDDLYTHPLLQEIITTQAVNFFVNLLGISSTLLLTLNSKDRPKIFSEILNYLVSVGSFRLLNELATQREKDLEKDLTRSLISIRDRIKKRWDKSKKFEDESESKVLQKLSDSSKLSFNKLTES
jgi:glutamate dehydrogenase